MMRGAATLDSCEILTEGWHGGHDDADVLFDAGGSISLTTRRGRDEKSHQAQIWYGTISPLARLYLLVKGLLLRACCAYK